MKELKGRFPLKVISILGHNIGQMNKYQKIALIIGVLILLVFFGKTVTRIGFSALGFMWKGIVIIAGILFIISFLKNAGKSK